MSVVRARSLLASPPREGWPAARSLRPALLACSALGIILAVYYWFLLLGGGLPADVHAYWRANLDDLYARPLADSTDGYFYSPAFAQAIEPLKAFGFDAFVAIWRGLSLLALAVMAGPLLGVLLFLSPVASEVNAGNINLLMGLAIVAGFRWPASWAFILLTKVTPGVALLWFAARGEWRKLGLATMGTLAVVGASFVLAPSLWFEWVGVLQANAAASHPVAPFWIPLLPRLPVAIAIVVWGGRTDRRWTVPVAVTLALPVLFYPALSILVAIIPLLGWARLWSRAGLIVERLREGREQGA